MIEERGRKRKFVEENRKENGQASTFIKKNKCIKKTKSVRIKCSTITRFFFNLVVLLYYFFRKFYVLGGGGFRDTTSSLDPTREMAKPSDDVGSADSKSATNVPVFRARNLFSDTKKDFKS